MILYWLNHGVWRRRLRTRVSRVLLPLVQYMVRRSSMQADRELARLGDAALRSSTTPACRAHLLWLWRLGELLDCIETDGAEPIVW